MEEKIPQLTLTPNLEEAPVLEPVKQEDLIEKSEKAPEAGPDLSMLSEAEQQAVLAFLRKGRIVWNRYERKTKWVRCRLESFLPTWRFP